MTKKSKKTEKRGLWHYAKKALDFIKDARDYGKMIAEFALIVGSVGTTYMVTADTDMAKNLKASVVDVFEQKKRPEIRKEPIPQEKLRIHQPQIQHEEPREKLDREIRETEELRRKSEDMRLREERVEMERVREKPEREMEDFESREEPEFHAFERDFAEESNFERSKPRIREQIRRR